MTVGTKSLLFGAHQFLLHPLLVALSWWRLYGFPRSPRLWVAFLVHDWGYWGKADMDGPEGSKHPELGARIVHWLFDCAHEPAWYAKLRDVPHDDPEKWYHFCLYHSRSYARRDRRPISQLCVADKGYLPLMPAWLFVLLGRLSGEIHEYMAGSQTRVNAGEPMTPEEQALATSGDPYAWHRGVASYLRRWIEAHKNKLDDTWTPSAAEEQ